MRPDAQRAYQRIVELRRTLQVQTNPFGGSLLCNVPHAAPFMTVL
jgi:hypothetical protein